MTRKTKRREANFIVQGSILAAASVISRLIGIVYRIPLTRILGDEGNGYYGAAYEVYNILLLLSCYSLPLAVSKCISANIGKGHYRNANRIYKCALYAAIAIGSIFCIGTYIGAGFLSEEVMSQPMSVFALKVLAPAILVVAIMGVLRGYFQGLGTMMPTAVSQIVEQIFNAVVSILGAYFLYSYGSKVGAILYNKSYAPAFGAAGGTLGTLLGGVAGLCFLLFVAKTYRRVFQKQMRRDHTRVRQSYQTIGKLLLLTVMPVILSTALYNISSVLDLGIFNYILERQGYEAKETASLYGIYSGKYRLLTNVPISITSALASSVVPTLTIAIARNEKRAALQKITTTIRFSMLIMIPSAIGLAVLASPILQLLFGDANTLPARLLQVGSISVVFYGLSTLTNAILQGINHMKTPLRNAAISLGIHLVCFILMLTLFELNVYAVVYANLIFAVSMCILNAFSIYKYIDYQQEIKKTFVFPFLSAAIMGGAAFGFYQLLFLLFSNTISTIGAIVVGAAAYFVFLLIFKVVHKDDLLRVPKGDFIVLICQKMHLLK